MDTLEIDWIPEDTGAPYEADMVEPEFSDIPGHLVDKICKKSLDIQTGLDYRR